MQWKETWCGKPFKANNTPSTICKNWFVNSNRSQFVFGFIIHVHCVSFVFSIIKTLRVSFNVLILKWNGLMSSHVLLLKVWHWFCSLPKTSMWERVWERCHRQGGKNQLLGIVQKLRSGFSLVLVSQILYETKIKQTLGVMSQTAVSQVIGDPKSSPWVSILKRLDDTPKWMVPNPQSWVP